MKKYGINEAFYSLQGEGVRAGTANVFLRFAGCNLRCAIEPGDKSPGGFDCDTEFAGSRLMTADEIVEYVNEMNTGGTKWVILTGGEPLLQVDRELFGALVSAGYHIAVETNGSVPIPDDLIFSWVTCSPKVAEHAVRLQRCNEVKYVRGYGQPIPKPSVAAGEKLISPAFDGDRVDRRTLEWCQNLVRENPEWRMSIQMHKWWNVR